MEKVDTTVNLSWPPCDIKEIEQKFVCPMCSQVMVNVHQADDCGCRYCLDCLDKIIESGERKCFKCKYDLASNFKIPDKYFQKKIRQIQINKCLGSTGCDWKGTLFEYRDHYRDHFALKLKIVCEFCGKDDFINHEELSVHIDKQFGVCPKQPIDCLFKSIGCNHSDTNNFGNIEIFRNVSPSSPSKAVESPSIQNAIETKWNGNLMETEDLQQNPTNTLLRGNLPRHMENSASYHLSLTHYFYNNELNKMKTKLENVGSIAASLSGVGSVSASDLRISNIRDSDNNYLEDDINQASTSSNYKELTKIETITDESTPPLDDNSKTTDNNDVYMESVISKFDERIDEKYQDLSKKIHLLENNQKGLINDFTRVTKNNDKLKQENGTLRDNIKEYKKICQDLHKALALTQVSLLTLEERLINQEKLSYNGQLLWKITNVNERMQEAKSGRQTSFYSPPFYTDRNGFKMCARIYLNGDGNGRGTYLSLFFVILRGEYDSLLKWPFRQKVTFTLVDQSELKEHVIDAFRPDPNSSSFRRPVSEMNIASGLPVFCPLGKLTSTDHEYIKDNTMYIEIVTNCVNSTI
jgi:hypothetical protein